jgi:hypothetical protein
MDLFTATDRNHLPQTVLSIKARNGLNYASTPGSQPIVEFDLPGALGFIIAEDTVLNFEFSYLSDGGEVQNIRPQSSTGLAGMIRQLDIFTNSGVLLEQILDYSVLQGILYSHDNGADEQVQDGEFNMRALTECYCRSDQNPQPFADPSVAPTNVYNGYTAQDNAAHSYRKQKVLLPIRLSALLGAAGRNNNSIVPLSALGGLRIRFTLHDCNTFTTLHSDDILNKTQFADWFFACPQDVGDAASVLFKITTGFNDVIDSGANTDTGDACVLTAGFYTAADLLTEIQTQIDAQFAAGLDVTWVTTDDGGTPPVITGYTGINFDNGTGAAINLDGNFTHNFCFDSGLYAEPAAPLLPIADSTDATLTLCVQGDANSSITNALATLPFTDIPIRWMSPFLGNPDDLNTQPFFAKTTVRGANTGTGGGTTTLGNIIKINSLAIPAGYGVINTDSTNGTDALPAYVNLNFAALPSDATAFDPSTIGANKSLRGGSAITTVPNEGNQYELNNVSLDVTVITPPPSYISAMMSAIQSADGLDYSVNTYETLRTNVTQGEAITQMNLPYINTKARAILSIPTAPGTRSVTTFTDCNLLRPLNLTKYFYTYSGVRHPTLGVDCQRLLSGLNAATYAPSLSQELINAQIQAFEYSMSPLRSLDAYRDGYTTKVFFVGRNLGVLNSTFNVQNQNLSLTLEATSGTAISQTLTVNHYLYAENVLKITSSGVEVFR